MDEAQKQWSLSATEISELQKEKVYRQKKVQLRFPDCLVIGEGKITTEDKSIWNQPHTGDIFNVCL